MMPSLSDTLRSTAARCPERAALVFAGVTTTYREFDELVESMAVALADRGVRPGDRVILLGKNSDTYVIATYAVLRSGAILVPANPLSSAAELAYLVDDADARAVLFAPELAQNAVAGAERADGTPLLLALGADTDSDDLLAAARAGDGRRLEHEPDEFDDALLMYTSGTTGRPKGALFDHHRILWTAFNCTGAFGHRDGARMLHVAPLYHAAELGVVLFPGVILAATHVILPAFDPVAVVYTLESERITTFFGVPTMYQFLLRVPDLATRDLSAWRVGLFGAAPMPPSVVTQLLAALPGVELFSLCGQTEAGPGGIYCGPEDVIARPDASGRYPLPNTVCRIVDKTGADVVPGKVGELLLRGESIMKGYWNKPEATAETLRDGWLHTGDLGLVDDDGYITLVDRLKDMIITGGRNVYSIEVENAIIEHPDVMDVAVVGVPHPEYGESILAVLQFREGQEVSLEDLRAFCKERLSSYKVPHSLAVRPIPRNLSGKIQKHLLRQQLQQA